MSRPSASSTSSPPAPLAPPCPPDVDALGRTAIMAPLVNPPYRWRRTPNEEASHLPRSERPCRLRLVRRGHAAGGSTRGGPVQGHHQDRLAEPALRRPGRPR